MPALLRRLFAVALREFLPGTRVLPSEEEPLESSLPFRQKFVGRRSSLDDMQQCMCKSMENEWTLYHPPIKHPAPNLWL